MSAYDEKRRGVHISHAIPEYVEKPYYGPDIVPPARCPDTGEPFCTCSAHVPPPPAAA